MTKQTKKLIAIFVIMVISMFAIVKANAEIAKVQELNGGCALYYSTQLWACVEVSDSKDEIIRACNEFGATNTPYYKKHYEGLPRFEETKIFKAEELNEDILKLLDISQAFYFTDSCWAGKKGGWHRTVAYWKEEGKIYGHSIVIKTMTYD